MCLILFLNLMQRLEFPPQYIVLILPEQKVVFDNADLLKHLCNMDYKQSLLSIQSKMNSKIVIQNINTKLLLKKDFM